MNMPHLPLLREDLIKCLPHRPPFLLVDSVSELSPSERIVGWFQVQPADPVLQGHFPGNPVYPGVLVLEAMAQTSAVLGFWSLPNGYGTLLLTEIQNARFKRKVLPGENLRFEIYVRKVRPPFFWFEGEASVDGELAAKAGFSALIK